MGRRGMGCEVVDVDVGVKVLVVGVGVVLGGVGGSVVVVVIVVVVVAVVVGGVVGDDNSRDGAEGEGLDEGEGVVGVDFDVKNKLKGMS